MRKSRKNLCVVVSCCTALLLIGGCKGGAKQAGPPAGGPVEVEVVTLAPQTIHLNMELPGRTAAFRIAEVRPQVSGIILKRQFEEGSEVKAGQVLYRIDPAPYQAAYDSAKAADHLRGKYDYLLKKGWVLTSEDFIARAASESSMSHKPYQVRCAGKEAEPSAAWLKAASASACRP